MSGEALARGHSRTRDRDVEGRDDELIADYELDRATIVLVGGGGGAAALIPFAAHALGFEHRIARNAEVISPLGVALALVRDVVERTIVDPSPGDLVRIRREAIDAAIRSGAAPDRIEVLVEIDRSRNRVRATASGATALAEGADAAADASDDERVTAGARALGAAPAAVRVAARTPAFLVLEGKRSLAIVDERAIVRLIAPQATVKRDDRRALGTRGRRGDRRRHDLRRRRARAARPLVAGRRAHRRTRRVARGRGRVRTRGRRRGRSAGRGAGRDRRRGEARRGRHRHDGGAVERIVLDRLQRLVDAFQCEDGRRRLECSSRGEGEKSRASSRVMLVTLRISRSPHSSGRSRIPGSGRDGSR